jgi:hypothetical protein
MPPTVVTGLRRTLCAAALVSLAGCALVTRGTEQDIRIETVSAEGQAPVAADCRQVGGPGVETSKATPGLKVHRSYDDLVIRCESDGHLVASARVVSRADMALVSLVVGGVISATVDQLSGAAYAYPDWITLVAGQERTYDRKDGAPGAATGVFARALGPEAGPVVASNAPSIASPVATPISVVRLVDPPNRYYRAVLEVPESHLQRADARPTGRDTYNAEKLALAMNCSATPRAVLVERGGGFELHEVPCSSGPAMSIRCEFGQCRPLAAVAIDKPAESVAPAVQPREPAAPAKAQVLTALLQAADSR